MTLDEAKTYLGNKHLLHPDNNVQRRPQVLSPLEKHAHQSVTERHVVESLMRSCVQGKIKVVDWKSVMEEPCEYSNETPVQKKAQ